MEDLQKMKQEQNLRRWAQLKEKLQILPKSAIVSRLPLLKSVEMTIGKAHPTLFCHSSAELAHMARMIRSLF